MNIWPPHLIRLKLNLTYRLILNTIANHFPWYWIHYGQLKLKGSKYSNIQRSHDQIDQRRKKSFDALDHFTRRSINSADGTDKRINDIRNQMHNTISRNNRIRLDNKGILNSNQRWQRQPSWILNKTLDRNVQACQSFKVSWTISQPENEMARVRGVNERFGDESWV